MEFLPQSLSILRQYPQFIIYFVVASKSRPGKTDKIPVNYSTGLPANPLDNNNWLQADDAIIRAKHLGPHFGVGFTLTQNDPFWFLDIDNCWDDTKNSWNDIAINLANIFNGAAIEISTSKRGLHILGCGHVPAHGTRNDALNLEFYTQKRFVALTGDGAQGDMSLDFTPILPQFITNYFPPANINDNNIDGWTTSPCEQWNGPDDDNKLIERALKSTSAASVFSNRASFKDLWEKNIDVLSQAYPDTFRDRQYDESSADIALAQHLAFWTGNNCERMLNLMQQSALARDKWQRANYLEMTILNACKLQRNWLCDKHVEISKPGNTEIKTISGVRFLTIDNQKELFKGCVYIRDQHKILVPGGDLLKPEQFRAHFGGYSFQMDNYNERITRNAWEAFTESQALECPKAASSCFKPQLEPAALIEEDERLLANVWWPIKTPRISGDASPFLNHLNKLLIDERDRIILLSYLAACVQYKGVKFQWAPLIQGVEGNGKSLLTACVAFAIGYKYVFFPKADQIGKNFNKWMYQMLLIAVEDIFVPDSQQEIIEALKPMITSDRLAIEPKGVDATTLSICCNFIINTNHKDGLRKTRNDRRFAPFYTPHQTKEDLLHDGLTPQYMSDLHNWLIYQNGFAIVSEFLHTFKIPPEFNPANKQIAPLTTSTNSAITEGLGVIEQEIIEAIDQELVGFRGGWISSIFLNRLLENLNVTRRISHNRRRSLLQSLNYDLHPHLPSGRVNNIVLPDGSKPRLFIHCDHHAKHLTDAAEIAKAYSAAQL